MIQNYLHKNTVTIDTHQFLLFVALTVVLGCEA